MTPDPFFLCGFGKSGTNWVGNLLNLHPAVRCDGEWHFQHFFHAWEEFARYPWQLGSRQPGRRVARAGVERLIRECLATMAEGRPGVTLVGDRSPRPLRELVRGSRTIYVFRDGRDVVVSYTFHHLRAGEAHHFPEHLRGSFVRHQRAFRDDPNAMRPDAPGLLADEAWVRETARFWGWRVLEDIKHGAGADTPTLLNIRYEDLHADVAAQCRRMYDFLGLDPALATPPEQDARTAPGFGRSNGGGGGGGGTMPKTDAASTARERWATGDASPRPSSPAGCARNRARRSSGWGTAGRAVPLGVSPVPTAPRPF